MELIVGEPGLSCFGHAIPQVASGVKLRHAGPAVFADGGGFASRIFEAMMSRKMQARAALAVAPSSGGLAEP